MPQDNIQSSFLEEVRKRLPPNLSFADELAEILNISRDSAYRRIRNETLLSLEEVKLVCNHYGVSLDALLSPKAEMVSFHHRVVDQKSFTIDQWLKSILANLEMLSGFPEEKYLIYSTPDIPVFYFFCNPMLAAFKLFVWMKTILQDERFTNQKFNPEFIPNELLAVGSRVWERYMALPCTEIWSHETFSVTLRQIEFYYECGLFANSKQAQEVCDSYLDMIRRIQDFAVRGTKDGLNGTFSLYKNELIVADTTILFRMGDKRVVFITHNTMNLLTTTQESFCQHTERYMSNLQQRSIMLSPTGEKERIKYFNSIEANTQRLKVKMA